ncbi:ankyrin repeat domain-containing protein 11-like [Sycon ciliatum]|uniref:ankyrin repeat domain-containing protein 11-like n=1 Tax=Sycon ciliatum TaxID=27933 RepID=UPI0031F71852
MELPALSPCENMPNYLETPSKRKRDEDIADPLADSTPHTHGSNSASLTSRSSGSKPLKRRLLTAFDKTPRRRSPSSDSSRSKSRSPQPAALSPRSEANSDGDDLPAQYTGSAKCRMSEEPAAKTPKLTERQQIAMVLRMTADESQPASESEEDGQSSAARARAMVRRRDRPVLDVKVACRIPACLSKRNTRGETPLHVASIRGDTEMVVALLERGADVSLKDNAGWTPLHEACSNGHLEIVQELLEAGAPVNVAGYNKDRPLHDAASYGHLGIIRELLKYGANPELCNATGECAADYAVSVGHTEVVDLLKSFRPRVSLLQAQQNQTDETEPAQSASISITSQADQSQERGDGEDTAPQPASKEPISARTDSDVSLVAGGLVCVVGATHRADAADSASSSPRMSLFEKFPACETQASNTSTESVAEYKPTSASVAEVSPRASDKHDTAREQPQACTSDTVVPRSKRRRLVRPSLRDQIHQSLSPAAIQTADKELPSAAPQVAVKMDDTEQELVSAPPPSQVAIQKEDVTSTTMDSGTCEEEAAPFTGDDSAILDDSDDWSVSIPSTPRTPFSRCRAAATGTVLPVIDSHDSGIATCHSDHSMTESPPCKVADRRAGSDVTAASPSPLPYRAYGCARFDLASLAPLRGRRVIGEGECKTESSSSVLVPSDPARLSQFLQQRREREAVEADKLGPALPGGNPPQLAKLRTSILQERYNLQQRFDDQLERMRGVYERNQRRIQAKCTQLPRPLTFCQVEVARITDGARLDYRDENDQEQVEYKDQLADNEQKRDAAMKDLVELQRVEWDGLLGLQCMQWRSLCSHLDADAATISCIAG